MCDSHSRNIAGFPVPDGTAVTLTFHSLQGMNYYIKILAIHLKANIFELTPIKITCNVSQPDMIKSFNQKECRIYFNIFDGAMNNPVSGLMNTYFHEQIRKGNKHKTKLPVTEALCLQHHDKKRKYALEKQSYPKISHQTQTEWKAYGKRPVKIMNVMRI